mmetsp:Transcript_32487/g.79770  ORF Transcript_32487/g.79770 Transcript_32487/m.79770 type:complete len:237 (+) Transcript_32487:3-713(+)
MMFPAEDVLNSFSCSRASGSETRAGVHVRVLPMPPDHPCHRCIRPLSPGRLQNRVLQHTWIAGDLSRWQRRCSALGEACVRQQSRCAGVHSNPMPPKSGTERAAIELTSLLTPVCRRTRDHHAAKSPDRGGSGQRRPRGVPCPAPGLAFAVCWCTHTHTACSVRVVLLLEQQMHLQPLSSPALCFINLCVCVSVGGVLPCNRSPPILRKYTCCCAQERSARRSARTARSIGAFGFQ